MKSSSGLYFIGLDHVRALAAFLVFAWHFVHIHNNHYTFQPLYPLNLLTEGHTGVALFMTLSGYLFAKILDGKSIIYRAFLWNRFLRLVPLLLLVVVIVGVNSYLRTGSVANYVQRVLLGVIFPYLPNGGWSITVEFHFYVLLPLMLLLASRSKYLLLLVVAAALLVRWALYLEEGTVQSLAYFTLVGRIDQFVLGILAYQCRDLIRGRHLTALLVFAGFALFYWYFDYLGGFFKSPSYPSPHVLWVYMTTVEGVSYAWLIAWYDNSFRHSQSKLSRLIADIGACSYSIYLLHFFFVARLAQLINDNIVDLSDVNVALAVAPLPFLLVYLIARLSYQYVELPFLKFRTRYIVRTERQVPEGGAATSMMEESSG